MFVDHPILNHLIEWEPSDTQCRVAVARHTVLGYVYNLSQIELTCDKST